TLNSEFGENYFSYTTPGSYSDTDNISYILSYTPLGSFGRMDAPGVTLNVAEANANTEAPVDNGPVDETPSQETPSQGGSDEGQTGTTPVTGNGAIILDNEYGIFKNQDGTLTFYVKAEDTSFGPMLYWGSNINDPKLWNLGGLFLTKDESLGENVFSYTTQQTFGNGDVINFLFSFTPVGAWGRMDTAVMSTPVSSISYPQREEAAATAPAVSEGEYGYIRNSDGTVTFYIYANVNEAAPLVFWGTNLVNPQLYMMAGAVMTLDNASTGRYTYTTSYKIGSGTSLSFMYGYTPVGESGRRDTAITTSTL
ncbi:MAG: hypothetical protein J6033_05350, partial [Lachnospiraceae bacterium]|nr:hypothetical protein [Lachnospiraceae bacterium]